jgi:type II secretion system protein L
MDKENYIVLKINNNHTLEAGCIVIRASQEAEEKASLLDAMDCLASKTFKVVVQVPTQYTVFFEQSLPDLSEGQSEKALLYALSDKCLDPIEELHVVVLHHDPSQGQYKGIMVARKDMQAWMACCQKKNVSPLYFIPDVLGLPYNEGQGTHYWITKEGILGRPEMYRGFYSSFSVADIMLSMDEAIGNTLAQWSLSEDAGLDEAQKKRFAGESQLRTYSFKDSAAFMVKSGLAWGNLLQGDFVRYDATQTLQGARAKRLLALFCIPLFLLLLMPFYQQHNRQAQIDAWKEKTDILLGYLESDQHKKIALEHATKRNRAQDMLEQYLKLGQAMEKDKSIKIEQLTYQNETKKIVLRISAKNFGALDHWRKALEKENLEVKQNWANSKEDKSEAEFTIHSR